jgi:conjugal transfer/entry exclusion protein
MNDLENSFAKQLQRNTVALISIVIAVSSLSYNTWRNEKTEANRNQRVAAFEILMKLSELQQIVFHHYYDKDTQDKGNPRTGWIYVLTIRDLSRLMPTRLHQDTDNLLEVWKNNWEGLEDDKASVDAILDGIEHTRTQMLSLLQSLE